MLSQVAKLCTVIESLCAGYIEDPAKVYDRLKLQRSEFRTVKPSSVGATPVSWLGAQFRHVLAIEAVLHARAKESIDEG